LVLKLFVINEKLKIKECKNMAIEYQCKNCSKKFKIREYAQLKVIYDPDTSTPTGRECNSCGNEIGIDDKNVTI